MLTRKDFMGSHEWCFYGWKEGAGHKFFGPNNATDLWHVKKVNPQQDGPSDGEARRVGRAGDAVLVAGRRERAGPVRRQRQHADRRRADRPEGVPDGTRRALLRRHRPAVASAGGIEPKTSSPRSTHSAAIARLSAIRRSQSRSTFTIFFLILIALLPSVCGLSRRSVRPHAAAVSAQVVGGAISSRCRSQGM